MAEFVIHGWPNCATATAGNGRISRPEWPRVPLELLYTFDGRKLLDLRPPTLSPRRRSVSRPRPCVHRAHKTVAAAAERYILKSTGWGEAHNVNDI